MYEIIVRSSGDGGVTIELRGELDLTSVEELRITLDNVASLCKPTTVDLSGVTFMDLQSTRELAVRSQLYSHHFTLTNPSWEAHASIKACKLESWIHFEDTEAPPRPWPLKKVS